MSNQEQIEAFVRDVTRVIDRYRSEFHLPLATAVGALEVIKLDLWREHLTPSDE